jgi:hypothetical protein
MPPKAKSLAASFWEPAKELAAVSSAVIAIVGGALYVFVTLLCIWVYEPLGVSPAEVGLGYGAVLIRTAAALVWLIAFYLVILGLVRLLAGSRGRRYWTHLVLVLVPCAFLLTIYGTWSDSNGMQNGEPPGRVAFGPPTPWDADVAQVLWTAGRQPAGLDLPNCLLYLGGSDATRVFYDPRPGRRRSLRIPSSSVVVAVLPDADSALNC